MIVWAPFARAALHDGVELAREVADPVVVAGLDDDHVDLPGALEDRLEGGVRDHAR